MTSGTRTPDYSSWQHPALTKTFTHQGCSARQGALRGTSQNAVQWPPFLMAPLRLRGWSQSNSRMEAFINSVPGGLMIVKWATRWHSLCSAPCWISKYIQASISRSLLDRLRTVTVKTFVLLPDQEWIWFDFKYDYIWHSLPVSGQYLDQVIITTLADGSARSATKQTSPWQTGPPEVLPSKHHHPGRRVHQKC